MSEMETEVPSPVPMREGKNGGRLRTGNPRGGGGRTPNEWIRMAQELVFAPETIAQIRTILAHRNHPAFASVLKLMTAYAAGRPVERLQLEAAIGSGASHKSLVIHNRVVAVIPGYRFDVDKDAYIPCEPETIKLAREQGYRPDDAPEQLIEQRTDVREKVGSGQLKLVASSTQRFSGTETEVSPEPRSHVANGSEVRRR